MSQPIIEAARQLRAVDHKDLRLQRPAGAEFVLERPGRRCSRARGLPPAGKHFYGNCSQWPTKRPGPNQPSSCGNPSC